LSRSEDESSSLFIKKNKTDDKETEEAGE